MSCFKSQNSLTGVKSVFLQHYENRRSKRIIVFENGNKNSTGVNINICPFRMRTWNIILQHITNALKPSFGIVKKLKTRDGKRTVHSFMDLERKKRYVACGDEKFKRLRKGYRTKSECALPVKYIEHYKKTKYESPLQENLHWTLDEAWKNKRTIIYVFINGKSNQTPEKFVLTAEELHNWYQTVEHMAKAIDMPEGICNLCTISGEWICGPFELQHGACYVAVPFGQKFKKLRYIDSYDNLVAEARRNGQLINKHDITAVSSPLGLKEKFSTCFHNHKKTKKPKRKYERFDSILLPLPLYEGEIGKVANTKSNKELKDLMREKNIPTSYLEESGREVPKREYYSTGIPSAYSRSVDKLKKNKDVEFIKVPEKREEQVDEKNLEKIGRRPSHLSQVTKKRLEDLEHGQRLDTDLKKELRNYLSSTGDMLTEGNGLLPKLQLKRSHSTDSNDKKSSNDEEELAPELQLSPVNSTESKRSKKSKRAEDRDVSNRSRSIDGRKDVASELKLSRFNSAESRRSKKSKKGAEDSEVSNRSGSIDGRGRGAPELRLSHVNSAESRRSKKSKEAEDRQVKNKGGSIGDENELVPELQLSHVKSAESKRSKESKKKSEVSNRSESIHGRNEVVPELKLSSVNSAESRRSKRSKRGLEDSIIRNGNESIKEEQEVHSTEQFDKERVTYDVVDVPDEKQVLVKDETRIFAWTVSVDVNVQTVRPAHDIQPIATTTKMHQAVVIGQVTSEMANASTGTHAVAITITGSTTAIKATMTITTGAYTQTGCREITEKGINADQPKIQTSEAGTVAKKVKKQEKGVEQVNGKRIETVESAVNASQRRRKTVETGSVTEKPPEFAEAGVGSKNKLKKPPQLAEASVGTIKKKPRKSIESSTETEEEVPVKKIQRGVDAAILGVEKPPETTESGNSAKEVEDHLTNTSNTKLSDTPQVTCSSCGPENQTDDACPVCNPNDQPTTTPIQTTCIACGPDKQLLSCPLCSPEVPKPMDQPNVLKSQDESTITLYSDDEMTSDTSTASTEYMLEIVQTIVDPRIEDERREVGTRSVASLNANDPVGLIMVTNVCFCGACCGCRSINNSREEINDNY